MDVGGLERLCAQEGVIEGVLRELRAGRKTGHWIWFVFPQVAGLGHSELSRYYAIGSLAEAREYLAHPELGSRLRDCARALLAIEDRTAEVILGPVDAAKVRSSMTLFHRVAPNRCSGRCSSATTADADPRTDALLGHPGYD